MAATEVRISITFHRNASDGGFAETAFSSSDGCKLAMEGSFWPRDLDLVNEIVKAVRARKDSYPTAKSTAITMEKQ